MAKTRKQKEEALKELTALFEKMKAVVFADFTHLSVQDMEDLRTKLREQGAVLRVVKKSLFNIALKKNKGLSSLQKKLAFSGPLSITLGLEDEVAPAKILAAFKQEHKKFEILGGILGGDILSAKEILSVAKLPSLLELRGKFVGVIAGPVRGLVNVLAGPMRNFIYVLNNLKEQREGQEA